MSLVNKDLNLLHCFSVLADEKSLSSAAKRLGLSQPALSYQLKNLREQFGDQLFIRTRKGYVVTPRAEQLIPEIRLILNAAEGLYSKPNFDLRSYSREFILASTTYFEATVIEKLMSILRLEAPLVSLKTVSLNDEPPNHGLDAGEYDLAVASYKMDLPKSFYSKIIGVDHQVCVVRKNHPYLAAAQNLKAYLNFEHIKINVPINSISRIDQVLETRKLGKRRVVAKFNNFLTPALVLLDSDCILTVPNRLARIYEKHFKLVSAPIPISKIEIETRMAWHERQDKDPFHIWIRMQIEQIFSIKK